MAQQPKDSKAAKAEVREAREALKVIDRAGEHDAEAILEAAKVLERVGCRVRRNRDRLAGK